MLFYTIGNARGMALNTIMLLIFGVLFFSKCSPKTKLIIMICLGLSLPSYILISNTARLLTAEIGFEDFWYRVGLFKEWRVATVGQSPAATAFGRLFFTAGHAIILRTPSEIPYRSFKLLHYLREIAEALIPGKIYYRPYYRGDIILRDYGFYVTETTSIDTSLLGSFWFLGGYLFIFAGGIAVGLFHSLIMLVLRRASSASKIKAFVYFSVFAPSVFWASRIGFIEHWRDMMYRFVLAFILYQVVKLIVAEAQYDENTLSEHISMAKDE